MAVAGGPRGALMDAFLEIDDLHKDFGGVRVLKGLSFQLNRGGLMCIVGPNGCGKTTLFNLLTGYLRPSEGAIRLDGTALTHLPPHEIARRGVGRKFQVPRVYDNATVRRNFDVPGFADAGRHGLRGLWRDRPKERQRQRDEILDLIGLAGRADDLAAELSHGERQWLEIGMVLAGDPDIMLLDEPTAGMTPAETAKTADLVRRIQKERGTATLVIEHDMGFVRSLGAPVAVMMDGAIVATGDYEDIRAMKEVREGYLGRGGHA